MTSKAPFALSSTTKAQGAIVSYTL